MVEYSIRPIRASKEAFKQLKLLAVKHDVSMGEMLEIIIAKFIKGDK